MPKRKLLKGLACGIASRFVSRNNDIDGYWALGVLYAAATAADSKSVHLDLLNRTSAPSFRHSTKVLAEFNDYLDGSLSKLGLAGYVFSGTIDLEFDSDRLPPSARGRKSTWGEPFACYVTLIDDLGRSRTGVKFGYCGQHDPVRERRSIRRYAE